MDSIVFSQCTCLNCAARVRRSQCVDFSINTPFNTLPGENKVCAWHFTPPAQFSMYQQYSCEASLSWQRLMGFQPVKDINVFLSSFQRLLRVSIFKHWWPELICFLMNWELLCDLSSVVYRHDPACGLWVLLYHHLRPPKSILLSWEAAPLLTYARNCRLPYYVRDALLTCFLASDPASWHISLRRGLW